MFASNFAFYPLIPRADRALCKNPNWYNFSPEKLEELRELIFEHYRRKGFPHFNFSDVQRKGVFYRLCSIDHSSLITPDGVIEQDFLGQSVASSYHPHMWHVSVRGKRSPMQLFMD